MTRKGKELIWTTMALAGVGLGALLASAARGEEGKPLEGPKVKQGQDGERRGPKAGGEGDALRERRRDGIHRLMEGVNPTDEQKEQIRTILQESEETVRAYREEHKAEFEQIRTDMKAAREAGDREKMKALGEQLRKLMEASPRQDIVEKIKAVLTPEQVKILEENIAKAKEQMRDRIREGQGGERAGRLTDEQREKFKNMTPEEREKFMQEHRPRRDRDGAPGGPGERKGDGDRNDKLDL